LNPAQLNSVSLNQIVGFVHLLDDILNQMGANVEPFISCLFGLLLCILQWTRQTSSASATTTTTTTTTTTVIPRELRTLCVRRLITFFDLFVSESTLSLFQQHGEMFATLLTAELTYLEKGLASYTSISSTIPPVLSLLEVLTSQRSSVSLLRASPLNTQCLPLLIALLCKPHLSRPLLESLLTIIEHLFEWHEHLGEMWTQHVDDLLSAMQRFIPQLTRLHQRSLRDRTFSLIAKLTTTLSTSAASSSYASQLIRLLLPFLHVRIRTVAASTAPPPATPTLIRRSNASSGNDNNNDDYDDNDDEEAHETQIHILTTISHLVQHVERVDLYVPMLSRHFLARHSPRSIAALLSLFHQLAAHSTAHDLRPLVRTMPLSTSTRTFSLRIVRSVLNESEEEEEEETN
jgi:hypothetical protein